MGDTEEWRHIRVSDESGFRTILLDRPTAKNAFNSRMYKEVFWALQAAVDRADIACVVIAGAGADFSAGWDLNEAADATHGDESTPDPRAYNQFISAVESFPKPLIGAVQGVAVGIGFTMLGHFDVVIFSESARMKAPFASLGLCQEAGSSVTLSRLLGPQLWAELLFTARWLPAAEAVASGMGLRVVPDAELHHHVKALACQIATQPVESLVVIKHLLLAHHLPEAHRSRLAEEFQFSRMNGSPANLAALERIRTRRSSG